MKKKSTRRWPRRRRRSGKDEKAQRKTERPGHAEDRSGAYFHSDPDYQGITVEDDNKLRRAVQGAGGTYRVVKNTLAELAGAGTPAEPLLKNLSGTNSIAYTSTDPVALAKVLTKVAKDVPAFKFKAGLVDGRVLSIPEIQQLANLPSKDELIGKIMFLLNAPAQRIASVLSALNRNLAVVVNEAVKAEKFGQ
jgi:large subunit ribosomal protein L10